MSKLRLVKVVCQAHFVLEDAEGNLTEQIAQPVEIPAKVWPRYATEQFPTAVTELEAQLNQTKT